MRVVCSTFEDFLEDIKCHVSSSKLVEGSGLLQDCVRISVTKRKIDEVRLEIGFQVSAVMCLDQGGEYLLEFGCGCGTDYNDATQEMNGTQAAEKLKERLGVFCGERGLCIRPGMINI